MVRSEMSLSFPVAIMEKLYSTTKFNGNHVARYYNKTSVYLIWWLASFIHSN